MKKAILIKLAETVLPQLISLVIKLVEELINFDLDKDGKIGK